MTDAATGAEPSGRQILAAEVARLRAQSGWSLAEVGDKVHYDRTYIFRLEKGESIGSSTAIKRLERVFGVHHLLPVWELAREEVIREKYQDFMDLERRATMRHEFVEGVLPGSLQTEEYARELFGTVVRRSAREVEEQVIARLGRQELLHGSEAAIYRAILDEAALRRAMSDKAAWRRQLEHLLVMADLPNVTLQVLPFSAGPQHILGGSTTLLWLADGKCLAYTEGSYDGRVIENRQIVESLHLAYDRLRDVALDPQRSRAFIERLLEDCPPCDPAAPT